MGKNKRSTWIATDAQDYHDNVHKDTYLPWWEANGGAASGGTANGEAANGGAANGSAANGGATNGGAANGR